MSVGRLNSGDYSLLRSVIQDWSASRAADAACPRAAFPIFRRHEQAMAGLSGVTGKIRRRRLKRR